MVVLLLALLSWLPPCADPAAVLGVGFGADGDSVEGGAAAAAVEGCVDASACAGFGAAGASGVGGAVAAAVEDCVVVAVVVEGVLGCSFEGGMLRGCSCAEVGAGGTAAVTGVGGLS